MNEPVFHDFLRYLMEREIIPAVVPPPGLSLRDYAGQLRERFSNPSLKHQTCQIAMDGTRKLPQRLLATLEEQLRAARAVDALCLAVAVTNRAGNMRFRTPWRAVYGILCDNMDNSRLSCVVRYWISGKSSVRNWLIMPLSGEKQAITCKNCSATLHWRRFPVLCGVGGCTNRRETTIMRQLYFLKCKYLRYKKLLCI